MELCVLAISVLMVGGVSGGRPSPVPSADPVSRPSVSYHYPPRPYSYGYMAGRYEGSLPDRLVYQEGDEQGVVRGSYAFLDPRQRWQAVAYEADPHQGFRVLKSTNALPKDTPAVAAAKERHAHLFARGGGQDTESVARRREHDAANYARIAAEHAAITAQHQRAARLEALQEQQQAQHEEQQRRRQQESSYLHQAQSTRPY